MRTQRENQHKAVLNKASAVQMGNGNLMGIYHDGGPVLPIKPLALFIPVSMTLRRNAGDVTW